MAKPIHLAALSFLVLLAACSDREPATGAPASEEAPTAAMTAGTDDPAAAPTEGAATQAASKLPPGVSLSMPVTHRTERSYTTKAGLGRHVVFFEFSSGDVAQTASALIRDMEAAGFRARPEDDRGDGKTRISFFKQGYGRVNATLTSDLGDNPNDPEAAGVFALDIPDQAEAGA